MESLIQWGIGLAVTGAVAAFIRYTPKQKMMDTVGPFMFGVGSIISHFGNSKIGKKAMNRVEEGILHTLIAVAMHGLVELGKGLVADNYTNEQGKNDEK